MTRAHRAPVGMRAILADWDMEYVLEYSDKSRWLGVADIQLTGGHRLIPTGCGTGFKVNAKVGGVWMSPLYIPFVK